MNSHNNFYYDNITNSCLIYKSCLLGVSVIPKILPTRFIRF